LALVLGCQWRLTELDAGTGEILRTFEGPQFTDEILCVDGTLCACQAQGLLNQQLKHLKLTDGRHIVHCLEQIEPDPPGRYRGKT